MRDIPKETIVNAAAGDKGAFEEIYRAYSAYVYTLAFRVTGNREDAEEVTQDVFVSAYRNLWKFRFRCKLKTWLYRVAINRAINAYRKRIRSSSGKIEFDETMTGKENRQIEKDDVREQVTRMLAVLPGEQRECLVLKELQGLKYEEIAESLSINLNTVKTRIKRAREKLAERYGKGGCHEM